MQNKLNLIDHWKFAVLWHMPRCSLADIHRHCRGYCCLHH